MPVSQLLFYALRGYLLTVLLETPVLLFGLSARHTVKQKLLLSVWLNACSYPVVSLVIPFLIDPFQDRILYMVVAEIFAPLSECLVFWFAFAGGESQNRRFLLRDLLAILFANLFSFGVGEVLYRCNLL